MDGVNPGMPGSGELMSETMGAPTQPEVQPEPTPVDGAPVDRGASNLAPSEAPPVGGGSMDGGIAEATPDLRQETPVTVAQAAAEDAAGQKEGQAPELQPNEVQPAPEPTSVTPEASDATKPVDGVGPATPPPPEKANTEEGAANLEASLGTDNTEGEAAPEPPQEQPPQPAIPEPTSPTVPPTPSVITPAGDVPSEAPMSEATAQPTDEQVISENVGKSPEFFNDEVKKLVQEIIDNAEALQKKAEELQAQLPKTAETKQGEAA